MIKFKRSALKFMSDGANGVDLLPFVIQFEMEPIPSGSQPGRDAMLRSTMVLPKELADSVYDALKSSSSRLATKSSSLVLPYIQPNWATVDRSGKVEVHSHKPAPNMQQGAWRSTHGFTVGTVDLTNMPMVVDWTDAIFRVHRRGTNFELEGYPNMMVAGLTAQITLLMSTWCDHSLPHSEPAKSAAVELEHITSLMVQVQDGMGLGEYVAVDGDGSVQAFSGKPQYEPRGRKWHGTAIYSLGTLQHKGEWVAWRCVFRVKDVVHNGLDGLCVLESTLGHSEGFMRALAEVFTKDAVRKSIVNVVCRTTGVPVSKLLGTTRLLPSEFKYIAADPDGAVYAHKELPVASPAGVWTSGSEPQTMWPGTRAQVATSALLGYIPAEQFRPDGAEEEWALWDHWQSMLWAVRDGRVQLWNHHSVPKWVETLGLEVCRVPSKDNNAGEE